MESKIYTSIDELVGNTPILRLSNIEKKYNLKAALLAKLEFLNPGGSAKDRVAVNMIKKAEKNGTLKKGGTIIEPTSGNTGIGLAAIAASKGYKCIIVLPDSMSKERILTMQAYGAKVVLTPGALGMKGAIEKAHELLSETPGSILAGQFTNPANPEAHFLTTGPEIYEATNGNLDCFVAGIGTGGTISGTGEYLKGKNKNIKIIGIEPENSAVLSGGKPGPHDLQGIGGGFIPETLNTSVYDEIITCSDEAAYTVGRELASDEGLLVGITSGAAVYAAIQLAKRPEYEGKTIVALLPDTGTRYLSTKMFS